VRTKIIGVALSALLLALNFPAEAQQPPAKIYRIGYLAHARSAGTEAFVLGLKDLGYIEGKNVAIEYRWAEGNEGRLATLAADIVRLKPDIILVGGSAAAHAARQVTKEIPIVLPDSADPVAGGVVASLSRPGGNVTGLTIMSTRLSGKRLELLKDTLPSMSRVAMLRRTAKTDAIDSFAVRKEMETTARSLGVQIQDIAVEKTSDFENAFSAIANGRVGAFILAPNPMFTYERKRIVELASNSRLPGIYPHNGFVEAGGLMSYAANPVDLFRRAASYVDKILKGANPADLPIEQPTKFEFVINLKTARQIGVNVPPHVLMWADQVIK
jgi:putative ABC transport system substrate-binding protein